jgi:isochorismate pyruvate lyase
LQQHGRGWAEIDRSIALVDLIGERLPSSIALGAQAVPVERACPGVSSKIDRVKTRAAEKGLPPELAEALWRQMIGWFIQYEEEKLRQQDEDKE